MDDRSFNCPCGEFCIVTVTVAIIIIIIISTECCYLMAMHPPLIDHIGSVSPIRLSSQMLTSTNHPKI